MKQTRKLLAISLAAAIMVLSVAVMAAGPLGDESLAEVMVPSASPEKEIITEEKQTEEAPEATPADPSASVEPTEQPQPSEGGETTEPGEGEDPEQPEQPEEPETPEEPEPEAPAVDTAPAVRLLVKDQGDGQILVELWGYNFATNIGSIRLGYDAGAVAPSALEGNKKLTVFKASIEKMACVGAKGVNLEATGKTLGYYLLLSPLANVSISEQMVYLSYAVNISAVQDGFLNENGQVEIGPEGRCLATLSFCKVGEVKADSFFIVPNAEGDINPTGVSIQAGESILDDWISDPAAVKIVLPGSTEPAPEEPQPEEPAPEETPAPETPLPEETPANGAGEENTPEQTETPVENGTEATPTEGEQAPAGEEVPAEG